MAASLRRSLCLSALAATFFAVELFISPALSGSLEEFRKADVPPGKSPNELRRQMDAFSKALETDLNDHALSVAQRTSAIFNLGFLRLYSKRFDEAVVDFSTLIQGTDPRVGAVPETSFYLAASLQWRAACYVELNRLKDAIADIDRAHALEPQNEFIRNMRDDILKLRKPSPA